jgi:hypothetical protein
MSIQVCNGRNVKTTDISGKPCRCGLVYNDTERERVHPHRLVSKDSERVGSATSRGSEFFPNRMLDVLLQCGCVRHSWGSIQYIGDRKRRVSNRYIVCDEHGEQMVVRKPATLLDIMMMREKEKGSDGRQLHFSILQQRLSFREDSEPPF